MSGYVYAVECNDAVKIGYTRTPSVRLNALQTGSPHGCRLLGVIVGTRDDEAELHRKYRLAHIRGEWFQKSLLADFIATLRPPPQSIVIPISREMMDDIEIIQMECRISLSETVVKLLSEALQHRANQRKRHPQ